MEFIDLKLTGALERTVLSDPEAPDTPESEYTLKVTVVYQDRRTQEWAEHVCGRMGYLVGEECLRCSWWPLDRLTEPEMFEAAVQAASVADVIVVSLHAAEELPEDLWTWIALWLPRRRQPTGALVTLLDVAEIPPGGASLTREYLRTVACKGGLDFLPHEEELPVKSLAEQTTPDRWWGINE